MPPLLRLACLVPLAALAACEAAGPAPAPRASAGYATEAYTPPGFRLPDAKGCGGEVARFKALMANDYATGNVALPVYQSIEADIDKAARVCAAGADARATAMLRASEARYGYPRD